ncbi:MAG: hypothetical protein IJN19_04685 [Opitutales bacterium]|nr:hypothetical protein [Opitutales bacterium]
MSSSSRNGTTQNDTFGYNPRSELVSATLGNANYAYAFDNIGNRATETVAGTQSSYSTNNLNQYTGISLREAAWLHSDAFRLLRENPEESYFEEGCFFQKYIYFRLGILFLIY